jgi:septum site-determining protein MinC
MSSNEEQLIKLKGVGDSLWVTVDTTRPVEALQNALVPTFERLTHLAANARVVIDSSGDEAASEELIDTLGRFLKERFQVGEVTGPQAGKKTVRKERVRHQDMGNAWHHYRSEALVIAGRVRSGQKIEAKKHLIIMGDLNPGAEAVAGGDILILGTLAGLAQAGQPDNPSAVIMALKFRPTQVQIGGIVAAGIASGEGGGPEIACVENEAIVVSDYIKDNPFKQLTWPEVR